MREPPTYPTKDRSVFADRTGKTHESRIAIQPRPQNGRHGQGRDHGSRSSQGAEYRAARHQGRWVPGARFERGGCQLCDRSNDPGQQCSAPRARGEMRFHTRTLRQAETLVRVSGQQLRFQATVSG